MPWEGTTPRTKSSPAYLEALAQLDKDDSILLVGPQDLLEQKLAAATYDKERLEHRRCART